VAQKGQIMVWSRPASSRSDLGFAMSFLMLAFVQLALALPPSDFWTNPGLGVETSAASQSAFEVTFALPQVLLFASMLAYLVAQLFDVRLYHFWWRVTGGKHMWVRNNGSTMISQLVDTIIVNGIFLRFGLKMEWDAIVAIIIAVYLCKVALAIIDTPLIYLGRAWLFRWLDIEPTSTPGRAPLA
ncbi:MAG: queuosine precursor transporter, partial [Planctomycetota bacterium]